MLPGLQLSGRVISTLPAASNARTSKAVSGLLLADRTQSRMEGPLFGKSRMTTKELIAQQDKYLRLAREARRDAKELKSAYLREKAGEEAAEFERLAREMTSELSGRNSPN